ncbi:glycosyl hydrolase [Gynuella sp.]|uniref:glycosyl hydrolase n=2 Tax=Gynuella sp. TaxID=2969146 RepID=UPI003D136599
MQRSKKNIWHRCQTTMLISSVVIGTFCTSAHAAITSVGSGSISSQANPEGYTCSIDHGYWIQNAGIVEPGIEGCNPPSGIIGAPKPLIPQLSGPASSEPTATHRWWGSVSFYGEMPVGDSSKTSYITPDPITARVTNLGFRMMGIPNGLKYDGNNAWQYSIPDPFSEVFDGIAFANTAHSNLDATLYDYSDGSVTVEWRDGGTAVMRATFVYGSPYVFIDVLSGQLKINTRGADGPERGLFYQNSNKLGIWTDVASNRNSFLIVGEGDTQYSNVNAASVTASNNSGHFTAVWLPVNDGLPSQAMIDDFAALALNRVDEVRIDYNVDLADNSVRIQQHYLFQNQEVTTMAGQMPLQWKNDQNASTSGYKVRSSRGIVRFHPLSQFSYELPFIGVLPSLPASNTAGYDVGKLKSLITEFVNRGESSWNTATDTYWAGKNYGKVAELAALAQQHGMTNEHDRLINWLKAELEDWFTATHDGQPDATKYFAYDDQWNTLLGFSESFGSQQQLNDHHFHYGYFVRAAAEICRTDKSWCAPDAWGGMVELLIRDYAAGRNDPMFPYTRNFDPANGFSWASGHANFVLGNNNESTSEAANAYGAIVLYGLITGNDELTRRGMYLHASSAASYWEYWNNIDRYRGLGSDYDNFPAAYDKMTTSIIWGNGMVFSTWFSGAYAHILGIQGLPLNPLVMHIGQHPDYLADYVTLGLKESSNGKPSGLASGEWSDIWWNILAMTDADASVADFNSRNFNYTVEAGESMAHTYHWINSWRQLGHLKSGDGTITSDYPAAMVFEKNGQLTYLAYNYSDTPKLVTFSDGMAVLVAANSFGRKVTGDMPDSQQSDTEAPYPAGTITVAQIMATSARLSWLPATDNVGVADYLVTVTPGDNRYTVKDTHLNLSGLMASTNYTVSIIARDASGNQSTATTATFTTDYPSSGDTAPTAPSQLTTSNITSSGASINWVAATDDYGIDHYQVTVSQQGSVLQTHELATTSMTLTGLSAGTEYLISVQAFDTVGQSSSATTVGLTTKNDGQTTCQTFCFEEQGDTLIVTAAVDASLIDFHYKVNGGTQLNVAMSKNDGVFQYRISGLLSNDVVDYFFTVIDGLAYDTDWSQYVFGSGSSGGDQNNCQDFCLNEKGSSLMVTAAVEATKIDLHYIVNDGVQMNVPMIKGNGDFSYEIPNLRANDTVDYFFTVINGLAYDTDWSRYTFRSAVATPPITADDADAKQDDQADNTSEPATDISASAGGAGSLLWLMIPLWLLGRRRRS